jgi:UDP-2-acetamido-3-amino-2,3-dideoxy-glucuronate N-acetyltransferase
MVCPESGYRYEEIKPGVLRCLDLEEESALPEKLSQGVRSYRSFRDDATRVETAMA